MGVLSNKISREELKPGDHIYSWRTAYIYTHHGIYIGEEKVIHFTRGAGQEIGTGTGLDHIIFSSSPHHFSANPCPRCGDQSRLNGVISSCIDCFLADGDLYLFQYNVSPAIFLAQARGGTCTLAASDPPADVIHRASFLLQNGFGGYHIFRNNCEDFAIYCKTGLLVSTSVSMGSSGQAASFSAASSLFSSSVGYVTASFSVLALVGCAATYCVRRILSDIGVRRDVTKVPVESFVAGSGIDKSVMVKEDSTTETGKKDSETEMGKQETTTETGKEGPAAETGEEGPDIGVRRDVTEVPVESFVAGSGIDKSVMAKEDSTTETGKEDSETEMGKQETTTETGKEGPAAETGEEGPAAYIVKEVAPVVS